MSAAWIDLPLAPAAAATTWRSIRHFTSAYTRARQFFFTAATRIARTAFSASGPFCCNMRASSQMTSFKSKRISFILASSSWNGSRGGYSRSSVGNGTRSSPGRQPLMACSSLVGDLKQGSSSCCVKKIIGSNGLRPGWRGNKRLSHLAIRGSLAALRDGRSARKSRNASRSKGSPSPINPAAMTASGVPVPRLVRRSDA